LNKKKKKDFSFYISAVLALTLVAVIIGAFAYFNFPNKKNEIPASTQKLSPINNLTGLSIDESKVKNRPFCVMINNIKTGQPLLGVSNADLMYECLVEGGITRIMACFKDVSLVPAIGSIRSARSYFIEIASGLDGIYIHEGGSTEALDMLSGSGCGDVSSIYLGKNPKYMWRDEDRLKNLGKEHSALTSGDLLQQAVSNLSIDAVQKPNYDSKLKFSDKSQVLEGQSANKLIAKFSGYKDTIFDYDSSASTYKISQFDSPQLDANSNKQNTKQNILALYIPTYSQPDSPLQTMDLKGQGEGYYMSRGKIIPITWHRDERLNSPFYFKTKDSEDLLILPGQSYVCIVPKDTGSISYS
jgi:hypothetical protein